MSIMMDDNEKPIDVGEAANMIVNYRMRIAEMERELQHRCDHCGANIIDNCPRCGAPQCCPQCCRIDDQSRRIAELEQQLAEAQKDAEYDQRNAAMSQEESAKLLDENESMQVELSDARSKYNKAIRRQLVLRKELAEAQADAERYRLALKRIAPTACPKCGDRAVQQIARDALQDIDAAREGSSK